MQRTKFAAMFLALALAFSLNAPALAAESTTAKPCPHEGAVFVDFSTAKI